MLSPIQKEIVEQPGNMIVRASAGTGKTHTMVSKIEYDIGQQHSHKVIAAITFTIKAANEIKERLKIDVRDHFIGTNNSFVIEEIIKPFMRDVYGKEYKVEMSTDYSIKVSCFNDGIAKIKNDKLLCSYCNKKENFIFQLALDIIKRSLACRLYLKSKYFKIYIDEYQDCDKDMHELFMYLCDRLNIDTFVVGDEKQSIYIWRGADPQSFLSIWEKKNFVKKYLYHNFRSCQQIQNYSNLLCKETRSLYQPVSDLSPIVMVCSTEKNWASSILPYIESNKKCAILRYSNANAKSCATKMEEIGLGFTYIPQTPIADITTEAAWIYNAVAKYFIVPKYSAYDFRNEIPNETFGNKKIIGYIKYNLESLSKNVNNNNIVEFSKQIKKMAEYFGYEVKDEHCQRLYTTISNSEYYPAFNMDSLQRIAITVHSSKGLEFDQVILFASDYKLSMGQEIYSHYVAVTRAKSKLIIVFLNNDENAKQFARNINAILAKSRLTIRDVTTVVGCST